MTYRNLCITQPGQAGNKKGDKLKGIISERILLTNVGRVNPNERHLGQVRVFFISSVLNSDIIASTLRMAILVKLDFSFYSARADYVSRQHI